jgi:hypothetical protein
MMSATPDSTKPPGASGSPATPGSKSLLRYIHARFRESFGEPGAMLIDDSQWTLRPDGSAPAIFLLVNGSAEKPAVWVFDPYDGDDNVWRTSIKAEAEVDLAIAEICRRMESAAGSRRASTT